MIAGDVVVGVQGWVVGLVKWGKIPGHATVMLWIRQAYDRRPVALGIVLLRLRLSGGVCLVAVSSAICGVGGRGGRVGFCDEKLVIVARRIWLGRGRVVSRMV